jgi:hypothetical protein
MANHITQWKPQVSYVDRYDERKHFIVKTYAEVRRKMAEYLDESQNREVYVSRSRRGQWGEWFEYWGFNAERKPVITKQGWM